MHGADRTVGRAISSCCSGREHTYPMRQQVQLSVALLVYLGYPSKVLVYKYRTPSERHDKRRCCRNLFNFSKLFFHHPCTLFAGNYLEQTPPFLAALWLHAAFVSPTSAAAAGWAWVGSRALYPWVYRLPFPGLFISTMVSFVYYFLFF